MVMAIHGKAAQTRIDNNKAWNELRRDRELPVAMVINPADSVWDRLLWSLDDRMRVAFAEYQMKRADRERLAQEMTTASRHSAEFVLFMAIATLLACIGLLQDSPAVIIGAMLVAPLMTPLLGAGLAMIQGNRPLFLAALRTILIGISISFGIGMIVGIVSLAVPKELFPNSQLRLTLEMISRSQPNLLDPLIGLAGGLAGGFAIGRDKKIGALAGVAIAAALVPPIATAGLETVIVLAAASSQGIGAAINTLVSDPATILSDADLISNRVDVTENTTSYVRLVFAPIALFLMNACAVILGAFIGLRLVGMHRSTFPRNQNAGCRWPACLFCWRSFCY